MSASEPAMHRSPEMGALRDQRDALQRQIQRFHVVQQINQELVSELDLQRLLHHILRSAVRVMEAQAGSLLLLDEATDELTFEVVEGGGGEKLRGKRMSRHQGIGGWVLNNQQAVIVDDALGDQRFYAEIGASVDYATTSMICAPMINRGKAIGVLQILNKQNGERFGESDKELLIVLAAQSAIAIRNAQLYQDLREERDRLVALEEDVRKRLARELHDGPTQIVAAVMMDLQFVRRLMEREPEKVDAELDEIYALAGQAMRQLRTMLFDLRPVILETKGLIPALEAYSSRLTETERFTVHLQVNGQIPRLDKQAESAIFAVVQEAISNAKKHTQADNMWIAVAQQDDVLSVSVRDDGEGFDPDKVLDNYESRGSLGMINMRERAEMIHGSFALTSAVGQGTTVRLIAPISLNQHA
jgi:signal transduction histidine kinase